MKLFERVAATALAGAASIAGLTASQAYGFHKDLTTLSAARAKKREEHAQIAAARASLFPKRDDEEAPKMKPQFPASAHK